MKPYYVALAALLALSACGSGGNPFDDTEETEDGDDTGDTGDAIDSDRVVPPGTESPSAAVGIFRSEATSTEDPYTGNGYAQSISYDSENDTFSVDGLGFDGDNTYARSTPYGNLGPFAVYEGDQIYHDSYDDEVIAQFNHRAIYGVSDSGNTQFAIVRTGAYVGYGFGGFVYQRDNEVTLPTTGQAQFTGKMAGLRDYNGAGGLEYTTGDVEIAIDFDDFNDTTGTRGDAVRGYISNRQIYDLNGVEITDNVINRINEENDAALTAIPTLVFDVGPGALDDNGEIIGTLNSWYVNSSGEADIYESGNYYAIVSGDAEEIVGVIVVENNIDPASSDSVRETGGFIVYN